MAGYALELSPGERERYRRMAERARTDEADAWRRAGIVPGAHVVDVGCGPGAVLLAMAEVVGPTGSVMGVDADPEAVATAAGLVRQAGVPARVQLGRADDTGLPAGSADVAVLRLVLAHNGGREQAIVDHLAQLVRPQGCVYLVDVELTALRFLRAPAEVLELGERYLAFHRRRGNDPQVGLRLGDLLRAAGLDVVDHSGTWLIMQAPPGVRPPSWAARAAMVAEGAASEEDVARWGRALDALDALERPEDRPVLFSPFFTATGRRP